MRCLKGKQLFTRISINMGCEHYYSTLDIVEIRFKCCFRYFPCYLCHQKEEDHTIQQWKEGEFTTKAVRCTACSNELTIKEYQTCNAQCPYCSAAFNPRCRLHWHFYFGMISFDEKIDPILHRIHGLVVCGNELK